MLDPTPLQWDTALATGYYVNEQICTAKGATIPQADLLPVPAAPLRANTKSVANVGPATLSINDPHSTAKTSLSAASISQSEISATTHRPISEPRQIGRVGSRGAADPRGLLTPICPPRTLSPPGSGPAHTAVPLHNITIINSAAKTNLALIFPPCGAEIICRGLPHRISPPGTRRTGTPPHLLAPTRLSRRTCKNS